MRGRPTQLAALVISVALIGCGGGGGASSTATTTSSTTVTTTNSALPSGANVSVLNGPVRASLQAANHAPVQGRPWAYTVRVTDPGGRALSGSVEIQFVFGNQVVGRDTPPSHPVRNGRWHDRLTFPPASVGQPLTFRAVVHTAAGSVTLDWPIRVTA